MFDEKKTCIRCLLKELSRKDYEENIERYIEAIKKSERANDDTYDFRLSICKGCDKLNAGTCLSCGCYVELRAASIYGKCPNKKW